MNLYSSLKALIIGVSQYTDPQYDLGHARSDAEAMANVLDTEFGFSDIKTLFDSDATHQNIRRYFEHDLQQVGDDDGILIFFAGHGITVPSAIGDDRGFLVPHDGNPKQPYANISLTAIRDDYLPMIPAKHVLLIVDACYSGLVLRNITSSSDSGDITEQVLADWTRRDRKVRQVLAAGTKEQRVLDGGLFGHSIFAGRLIETLREADPYITADRLGVQVRERVSRDSLDRNHRQTPQWGHLVGTTGSFVFCRNRISEPIRPRPSSQQAHISHLSSEEVASDARCISSLIEHGRRIAAELNARLETRRNLWMQEAESGSAEAQWLIGISALMGRCQELRPPAGMRWLSEAAAQDFAPALYSVGIGHQYGFGCVPSVAEAVTSYRGAAQKNYAPAQYRYGMAYWYGEAVGKNQVLSLEWQLKAASQGYPPAEFQLAVSYAYGIGTARDLKQATDWLCKAAKHGLRDAQFMLGTWYELGIGVKADQDQAEQFYRLAAYQGVPQAEACIAGDSRENQDSRIFDVDAVGKVSSRDPELKKTRQKGFVAEDSSAD